MLRYNDILEMAEMLNLFEEEKSMISLIVAVIVAFGVSWSV